MIHYAQCPVCSSELINKSILIKDYSVSEALFELWSCANCTAMFTQNVPDVESIGAYYQSENYISHSDTQKGLINSLYHLVRNYTLKRKRTLIKRASGLRKGRLLDVGAGTGAFAHTMLAAGWEVTALEPDKGAATVAKKKYGLSLMPYETLFKLEDRFDVITLWHVLEHVHDLQGYLNRFNALLKPGGKLIIAVPNYKSEDRRHYGSFWAAWDVPRHLYHFSPLSMEMLLKRHGFTLASVKPMWFDSFYVSLLSEKYKSGKNNFLRAFCWGIRSNWAAFRKTERCSSVIYIARQN